MSPSSRSYRGVSPSARMQLRRSRLVDAGVEVFGTVGYRAATVDQVCAGAALSKRYFYESFSGSESLLLACYERCADDIHQAMLAAFATASSTDDGIEAQVRGALSGYFGAIDADPRRARITLLEILGVSPAIDAAYAGQTARFADSLLVLGGDAFGASSLPAAQVHLVAQGIIGAITTVATQWLLEGRTRPCSDLVDATLVLVLAVLDRLPST